jgi:hypothetical protein
MREVFMRRVAPAIGLFFLAPLISEYLLGNLPITLLAALVILAPLYGGGALLIRETVRRSGRGWPTMIVLALVYAIVEEAFVTQTLFNPNYLHLNLGLLKPAYIPALGIGGWWTVYVLSLHTVWSISVSVALMEALVPERATTPWLGNLGLGVTAVLFALGAAAATRMEIEQDHFIATVGQFVGAAVAAVVLTMVAFLLPKGSSGEETGRRAPSPWLVGMAALVAGSIFMLVPKRWGWWAVGVYAAVDLAMIVAVSRWSKLEAWSGMHRLALAGGAALVYAWHSFVQVPVVGNKSLVVARVGNAVFAAGLLLLLWIAARRNATPSVATADQGPAAHEA